MKKVGDKSQKDKKFTEKNHTDIRPEYYDIVQDGMQKVLESGTAAASQIKGITVLGKTGTAQNPGKDHSLCTAGKSKDRYWDHGRKRRMG